MLTVHHLAVSQSERIVWLCEELDLSYELVRYERDAQTKLAPSEYKALHPLGTAPVITDGDTVLAESSAVVEYILARYGNGRLAPAPNDSEFADYLFWFHFSNGSVMPTKRLFNLASGAAAGAINSDVMDALTGRLDVTHHLIEERLGSVDYFAGNTFTAADIMNVFALTTMRVFIPFDLTDFPNIRAYLNRIGTRAAYQQAMKKGDLNRPPNLVQSEDGSFLPKANT